jgi:hypothetical protein
MQKGHRSIEIQLCLLRAANRKVHRTEIMTSVLLKLAAWLSGAAIKQNCHQTGKEACEARTTGARYRATELPHGKPGAFTP